MAILTILDPTASPETGVGDGDSGIILIGQSDTLKPAPIELVPITFQADYSGAGAATVTPYYCADPGESPRRWTEVKKIKDDGSSASVAQTADFVIVLSLPAGSIVKWTVSGSGSPLPSIDMKARGYCKGTA